MMSESDFELRGWSRDTSVVFRKTKEKWGGLSNMAAGYPIEVNGEIWATSEALYQALRFPNHPEIQEMIRLERSPMAAKMKSKPFRRELSRADWDSVRIEAMWWCLQAKYVANLEKFGLLLKNTLNAEIVEDSPRDQFWGAVPLGDDGLQGRNVLGRLLMKLRREIKVGDALWVEDQLAVPKPSIPGSRILGIEMHAVTVGSVGPSTLF